MQQHSRNEMIQYRLQRSKQTIAEAKGAQRRASVLKCGGC